MLFSINNVLTVLISLCLTSIAVAQDIELNVYADRTNISLNQQFQLTVELNGSDANSAPQPDAPSLSGFASFIGSSSSTNMQYINGKMSVTKQYIYHYIAVEKGEFVVPAIEIFFKGKDYASEPFTIKVVDADRQPANPHRSSRTNRNSNTQSGESELSDLLYLKAEPSKRTIYQNEAVIISYKIYTALNVSNYSITKLPNSVGFWSEDFELPNRPRITNEVINGREFRVAEVKRVALFPQGPGGKQIEPLALDCEVQLPRRRTRRDPFDSIFDDPFFSFGRRSKQRIVSNTIDINVLPLPTQNKPVNFSGAVGKYSISATVDKQNTKTNEAVSFKVRVSGTGNIKIIPLPKINFPSDFEVYEPKIIESIKRDGQQMSGSKIFEYVLIPRFPGNQTIKPITFSYFDLASKSYKIAATRAINLTVEKGDDQFINMAVGNSKEDVEFIGQDIRYIHLSVAEFNKIGDVFYKNWFFYMLLFLPLVALIGAFVYQAHVEKMSTNVAYARNRKANQMALKKLKAASQQMKSGDSTQFYAEVSNALMGFIGDKLNVSAAGLITDEVDSMLKERGISNQIVLEYLACLQACDFQRFAPSESENGSMQIFFEKAKNAIISLDKEIKS